MTPSAPAREEPRSEGGPGTYFILTYFIFGMQDKVMDFTVEVSSYIFW